MRNTEGVIQDEAGEMSMLDLDTVITAFFLAIPNPTDAQLHVFADLIGVDYRDLEERVFSMVGHEIQDLEPQIQNLDQEDLDDLGWDPMDMFLAGFFLLNPEPTEEQVHALAELVGIPAPDLEERVYALLSQMVEGEDEDDDDDEDYEDDEEVSSCAEDRLKQYASLTGSRGDTDD
jgi:hypothetical protein